MLKSNDNNKYRKYLAAFEQDDEDYENEVQALIKKDPLLSEMNEIHEIMQLTNKERMIWSKKSKDFDEAQEECFICCRKYNRHDKVTLKCGHTLHKDCLELWLKVNSTCPICRAQI